MTNPFRHLMAIALPAAVLGAALVSAASASAAQASATPAAARCTTSYLASALHLSHVTVDSASPDTTGSYTPPGSTAPITGLPDFCNAALTQTDSAGNAIHIDVWLPVKWNGRFQGIGGGGYSCGITYAGTGGPLPPCRRASTTATRPYPPTAGSRRPAY